MIILDQKCTRFPLYRAAKSTQSYTQGRFIAISWEVILGLGKVMIPVTPPKRDQIVAAKLCLASKHLASKVTCDMPVMENETSADLLNEERLSKLVHVHGLHPNHHALTPNLASLLDPSNAEIVPSASIDFGAFEAHVAAKRVAMYKIRQTQTAEKEREKEKAWVEARRLIRKSNEAMHKALGIAGLSAQDHLNLAQHRRKQEIRVEKESSDTERQNRWYNCPSKRLVKASNNQTPYSNQYQKRANDEMKRLVELKQRTIKTNLLKLRKQTYEIISKAGGAYVRGSYLLKMPNRTVRKRNNSQAS